MSGGLPSAATVSRQKMIATIDLSAISYSATGVQVFQVACKTALSLAAGTKVVAQDVPQVNDDGLGSVRKCITSLEADEQNEQNVCVTARVRIGGKKPWGGGYRTNDRACITPPITHEIIGIPTVTMEACAEDRCRADSVATETDSDGRIISSCFTIYGWPEDIYFGGGASSRYRMCGDVKKTLTDEDRDRIRSFCETFTENESFREAFLGAPVQ